MVVRPNRYASADDDHVAALQRPRKRLAGGQRIVGDRRQAPDLRAAEPGKGPDGERVGVIDRSRPRALPGLEQLIARHHQRQARTPRALDLSRAHRRERAELCRADRAPRAQHQLARSQIVARVPDVVARRPPPRAPPRSARRERSARPRPPHPPRSASQRLSRSRSPPRTGARAAAGCPARDSSTTRRLTGVCGPASRTSACANGEPVHRRVVERRHRPRAGHVCRQHPSERVAQIHLLALQPARASQHRLARVVDLDQLRRTHCLHERSRGLARVS